MKRWTTTWTIVACLLAACLFCCATAEAKKGGNGGKGGGGGGGDGGEDGGGETAPYTLVTLDGSNGYAFSVNEPDGSDAVCVVGIMDVGAARHPAFWDVKSDGSFTTFDLGLPAGATNAHASDVNDFGVITIHTEDTTEVDENGHLILPGWVLVPGLPHSGTAADGQFRAGACREQLGRHCRLYERGKGALGSG